MVRRLLAVAVCAVFAATAVPSHAATLKACPTFTDPKGDSFLTVESAKTPLADPALDITSVKFKPVGKSLGMAITVAKYAARPAYAYGNRYQVEFTLGGRLITVYYKQSATRAQEGKVFYQAAMKDGTAVASGDVQATVVGNTITMLVTNKVLNASLGSKAIGSKITGLHAYAYGSYVGYNLGWDSATAKSSLSYVLGSACK